MLIFIMMLSLLSSASSTSLLCYDSCVSDVSKCPSQCDTYYGFCIRGAHSLLFRYRCLACSKRCHACCQFKKLQKEDNEIEYLDWRIEDTSEWTVFWWIWSSNNQKWIFFCCFVDLYGIFSTFKVLVGLLFCNKLTLWLQLNLFL